MPSSCGYAWSLELDAIIREEAQLAGVPIDLAYTFVAVESSFDPRAHALNDIEDSVGLLQLNRRGGQGAGYTVEQLMDPRFNLRLGLPAIAAAYAIAWQPSRPAYEFLWAVAVGSGHPGSVPLGDARIVRIFQVWACFSSGVGHYGPGGAPGAAFVPGPGQSLAAFTAAFTLLFLFPGGLLRLLVGTINPMDKVRGQLRSLTPGGFQRRLISPFSPAALLPGGRFLALARPHVRLPPGHRPPRRLPRR